MSKSWTIAYRKPRASTVRRVTDWSGTESEAVQMAARFGAAHPALQVYTVPAGAHTVRTATGKRVRLVDTGTVSDLVPRGVRYIPRSYLNENEWEWGVFDLVGKAFLIGGCDRGEAVQLARRACDLQSA